MQMAGQFMAHLQMSAMVGIILAFPYFVWEMWRFIEPGLYDTERKYASGIVWYCSFLFLVGIAFGYYLLVPFSMNFLVDYQTSIYVENTVALASYISFIATLVLLTGFVFEMPIAVYFLSKVGIITPAIMRDYRRHALLGVVVIAAIITPPDVMSQMLVTIPMYLLYEISIYVSAAVKRDLDAQEALAAERAAETLPAYTPEDTYPSSSVRQMMNKKDK